MQKDGRARPTAEEATSALVSTFLSLSRLMHDGWMRADGGFVAGVTGLQVPIMNGVWGVGPDDSVAAVERWIDEIASAGVPFCLQTRPGAEAAERAGRERGMTFLEHLPLMGIGELADIEGQHATLSSERISSPDRHHYLDVVTRGFEVPAEVFEPFLTDELMDDPSSICLVGNVGGVPVTTALVSLHGEAAGVFNVATPPEHRRKGYGAAITARCLAAARAAGATWGYLQSSEMGLHVYERLGFRTLERWSVLVHEGAS